MFTPSRTHRPAAQALALLLGLALGACSDEHSISAPRSAADAKTLRGEFYSDAPVGLLSVELSGGELREPLIYNVPLGGRELQPSLAIPAGKGYGAIVRAYDSNGEITHEGKLYLEGVQIGENESIGLSLEPVGKGEGLKLGLALIGEEPTKEELTIVIRADRKSVLDGESVTLRAIVLDAFGHEVPVDPSEIHWAILDPRTGKLVPSMSNEMAAATYTSRYLTSKYYATLIAEYRQWRKDWLQQIVVDPWVDVSAGGQVTCALRGSGKLYCWGINSFKMLGTTKDSACGGYNCSSAPLLVEGGRRFSNVSVGQMHVCAVEQNTGKPFCWGDNIFNILGQPMSMVSSAATPMEVSGSPPAFKSISAGWNHTCGVTTTGTAMCWGYYWNGRLGTGSTTSQSAPVAVSAPTGLSQVTYTSVTAGMLHSCGITTASKIFCWGQLGGVTYSAPNEVAAVNGASWSTLGLSSTAQAVCATNSASLTMCWGEGSGGQLGNNLYGAGVKSATPVLVKNTSGGAFSPAFVSTTTGYIHSCGLTASGNAFCWGENSEGQLGNSSQVAAKTPVGAGALSFTKISAGNGHTCAIDSNADIYCWGTNVWGQLGLGDRSRTLPIGGTLGVSSPTKVVAPVP